MIYIETPTNDVYRIFGTELFYATERDPGEDVFLLWHTVPTLVVGKFQNVREEINLSYAQKKGLKIVRRESGGGTMFIDLGSYQFSFIHRGENEEIDFSRYVNPIIAALSSMGINAELTGRNDITIGGKKISGNSQYRKDGVTVHHGTLLFSGDIETMVRATTVDSYKITSKSIKSVRERVTNISEHFPAGGALTGDEFSEKIISFVLGENGKRYSPCDEELKRIEEIADERFRGEDNIFGRDPKYNLETVSHLPGGKVSFKLDIKNNVIETAKIYGDFFASVDAEKIENALAGVKYKKEDIISSLEKSGLDGKLFKITVPQLACAVLGEE